MENKQIICLETGKTYPDIKTATAQTPQGSKIKDAVGGRRRVAGGYHWCAIKDLSANYSSEDLQEKIKQIDLNFDYVNGRKITRGKRVLNIDTGEEFYTATDAALHYGLSNDCVAACCRGERETAGGCHWKYVD